MRRINYTTWTPSTPTNQQFYTWSNKLPVKTPMFPSLMEQHQLYSFRLRRIFILFQKIDVKLKLSSRRLAATPTHTWIQMQRLSSPMHGTTPSHLEVSKQVVCNQAVHWQILAASLAIPQHILQPRGSKVQHGRKVSPSRAEPVNLVPRTQLYKEPCSRKVSPLGAQPLNLVPRT
jgi:hypothetical protein